MRLSLFSRTSAAPSDFGWLMQISFRNQLIWQKANHSANNCCKTLFSKVLFSATNAQKKG